MYEVYAYYQYTFRSIFPDVRRNCLVIGSSKKKELIRVQSSSLQVGPGTRPAPSADLRGASLPVVLPALRAMVRRAQHPRHLPGGADLSWKVRYRTVPWFFSQMSKLYRARPLLYRRQLLQGNIRWKTLDEIYKIYMLLHRSDLINISETDRNSSSNFWAFSKLLSTTIVEVL